MEQNNQLKIGVGLILLSSAATCSGQLCWKLGAVYSEHVVLFYLIGFLLYGMGALLMILSFKFGEMSILHPMLSVGFIGSLFLGAIFLNEDIQPRRVIGVLLILVGVCFLNYQGHREQDKGNQR